MIHYTPMKPTGYVENNNTSTKSSNSQWHSIKDLLLKFLHTHIDMISSEVFIIECKSCFICITFIIVIINNYK